MSDETAEWVPAGREQSERSAGRLLVGSEEEKTCFRQSDKDREIGIVERRFALSGASSVCDLKCRCGDWTIMEKGLG